MKTIKIDRNVLCKSILFVIICSILVPSALAQDKIVVNTNRLTVLDDPSGWVYAGWGSQTARGNQMLGEQTTIKWYALVIDQNGTAVPGVDVSTNLRFPNNTIYYSTIGTTDDNGTVEFSKNLDNLNQRPYFATSTEGYWRADVSATVSGQPISSNTRFIYDEIGCGKSGSGCHKSQDWQPSTGASTKSITNGGTFVSPSRNSPYVQNRDKIHGTLEGHGHVDLDSNPPISSGECVTCHKSYNGTYIVGSVRQNDDPQYPGGVHQNQVNCTQCHGSFVTEPDVMILDMPVKKCYDCHPEMNDNLTVMNYIQDATNSYSYNPLSTSNTVKGHNGSIPCITCHNNGHNITKPYLDSSNTITEYQQCLTCHTTYNLHNGGVDCTVCHSQDAHIIKIFSQNADYVVGKSNPSRGNCTNCHENSTFLNDLEGQPNAGSYTGDAPQIGIEFNHSTGEKWNRTGDPSFWSDQLNACKYCHGDTKHDTDGLGNPNVFKGTNSINVSGTWCGTCHYNRNSEYSNMLGTMNLIPPEITGDSTYGNYGEGYFDHSGISGFQDSSCRGCHGNRPSLTTLMHNAGPGTEGGPDCVSCHNVGGGGDQPHVNVSAMNKTYSIHKDLNSGVTTSLNIDNKRCWACHGNGTEPEEHPDNYKTPYNCTDCHTGSNRNFTPSNTIKVVSEHYWSGSQIVTNAVTSCYKCHNRSEMMIFANDPDIGTVYGGINNGNKSTSHYGKKRTDLVPGTRQYCNYCHNSTIDSFFDVFVDVYNTDIQNHSRYGTNPKCQDCHDSSSGSRIHDSNLTFNELALPTSDMCLTCHGPGGTASIKDKYKHNNTVECSVCHLNNGKDIHPIKYLNNTDGFNINKAQGIKCDRCHETGRYDAPAIGKVRHSDNTWNGSLWSIGAGRPSEFWDNNSLNTACEYCHGNSKHNTSALGRLNGIKGTNRINVFGTWCGICHYQGNSQFSSMIGVMSGIGVPPEVSKHVTYGNYVNARDGTPYFNHSLNRYNDTRCDDCHYAGTPPNLTKSMHNVVVGGTSCLGCHSTDVDTTKFGKHANVSKVGSGVTDDDCKGCHFNVLTLGQMLPGYANYSNTYYCNDCHNASGRNHAQYNNITDPTLKKDSTTHAQANCTMCHIPAGQVYHPNGPKGTAKDKNCYSCHYRTDGVGNTPNVANVGQNDGPFYAPGEDHVCNSCHDSGLRPTLTGGNGCGHCHGATANNHYVQYGGHYGQTLTINSITVDTPITAGTIANVTGVIGNEFVQVAKAQYRITNSAGTVVIRDWTGMNATDGKFNGRAENVKGRIGTTGLSGTYKVQVRGMISGYWATGGSGHNAALPYYPDNGLWTGTVSTTMQVTGQTIYQVLASGQLYYPGSWYSHFKVGNAGSTTNVNVSFYNSAGTRVNTTTTSIARNTSADYRWQTYAPGVTEGTALINSSQPISVITFQRANTDGRLGFWEGILLNTGSTEVFVPGLVYYPGSWRSVFKVLNVEDTAASVTIYFYNSAGNEVKNITRTIAPKTSPGYDWYTFGYNVTGGSSEGTAKVVSNRRIQVTSSQASENVGKLGFWEGIPLNAQSTNVFVSGLVYYPGSWRSVFKVANYDTSSASVTIRFYNSSGKEVKNITRTIAPKTSPGYDWYTYGYNVAGGTSEGTAIVTSNQPIKVISSQAAETQGMIDFYQASEISGNNTAFVLYQKYDGIERSVFKIANPGTTTISATIRFYDQNGALVNTTTRNIASKTSPGYAWNTFAPGVTNGSVVVEATGRIVVIASFASEQASRLGIFRGVNI